MKKAYDGDVDALNDLFVSDRIDSEIDEQKILFNSFNLDRILSYLPYYSKIYVSICMACITEKNIEAYKILTSSGSIVPVLTNPYNSYIDTVAEHTYALDHVSAYEYNAFRSIATGHGKKGRICPHCVGKRKTEILDLLKERKGIKLQSEQINRAFTVLRPYVNPDFALIDDLYNAIDGKNREEAVKILRLSEYVYDIRTAEAFNSPLVIDGTGYGSIPKGISKEIDITVDAGNDAQRRIADGLGIRIPRDIKLEQYIELSNDFRPRIEKLVDGVIGKVSVTDSETAIHREIMRINSEANRLSKSTRYLALEACVDFYRNNNIAINATLVAGSLGLAFGLAGCAGGAVSGAVGIAKKKGWLKETPAAKRAGRAIQNTVQPVLDKLVASYLDGSHLAVSVLSLRNDLGKASQANPTAKPAVAKKSSRPSKSKS